MTSLTFVEHGQTVRITDEAPPAIGDDPAVEVSGDGPIPPGLYFPRSVLASDGERAITIRDALSSKLTRMNYSGDRGRLAQRFLDAHDDH